MLKTYIVPVPNFPYIVLSKLMAHSHNLPKNLLDFLCSVTIADDVTEIDERFDMFCSAIGCPTELIKELGSFLYTELPRLPVDLVDEMLLEETGYSYVTANFVSPYLMAVETEVYKDITVFYE